MQGSKNINCNIIRYLLQHNHPVLATAFFIFNLRTLLTMDAAWSSSVACMGKLRGAAACRRLRHQRGPPRPRASRALRTSASTWEKLRGAAGRGRIAGELCPRPCPAVL